MNDEDAKQLYGETCVEWLRRWDSGGIVWTLEMGGLGPTYEQCIQITMSEVLRYLVENEIPVEYLESREIWPKIQKVLDERLLEMHDIKELRLSGAQWQAAISLACQMYKRTPWVIMTDPAMEDRRIQTSDCFQLKP